METSVIGILEFNSIAAGIIAMDSMVKSAPIVILKADVFNPGKFIIIVTGDVASVDASLLKGKENRLNWLVDELFIPNLNNQIIPALGSCRPVKAWDALGVLESYSITSGVEAADRAAKEADVEIPEIGISTELSGKSYVKIMGAVEAVEAAVDAGSSVLKQKGLFCNRIVIPRPHPDIQSYVAILNKRKKNR